MVLWFSLFQEGLTPPFPRSDLGFYGPTLQMDIERCRISNLSYHANPILIGVSHYRTSLAQYDKICYVESLKEFSSVITFPMDCLPILNNQQFILCPEHSRALKRIEMKS
ncbi:hypothetical protein AVEN_33514-1 [Araneus ventricosus]|uniref:Uncharacterized protein n=1 Tax=Araneus ventricosus TaxID=182803 RepID=A0A4Y2GQB9_ARAVE|nr:hypothetical protein AVEN_33514-1 [Araneus ventricosus]